MVNFKRLGCLTAALGVVTTLAVGGVAYVSRILHHPPATATQLVQDQPGPTTPDDPCKTPDRVAYIGEQDQTLTSCDKQVTLTIPRGLTVNQTVDETVKETTAHSVKIHPDGEGYVIRAFDATHLTPDEALTGPITPPITLCQKVEDCNVQGELNGQPVQGTCQNGQFCAELDHLSTWRLVPTQTTGASTSATLPASPAPTSPPTPAEAPQPTSSYRTTPPAVAPTPTAAVPSPVALAPPNPSSPPASSLEHIAEEASEAAAPAPTAVEPYTVQVRPGDTFRGQLRKALTEHRIIVPTRTLFNQLASAYARHIGVDSKKRLRGGDTLNFTFVQQAAQQPLEGRLVTLFGLLGQTVKVPERPKTCTTSAQYPTPSHCAAVALPYMGVPPNGSINAMAGEVLADQKGLDPRKVPAGTPFDLKPLYDRFSDGADPKTVAADIIREGREIQKRRAKPPQTTWHYKGRTYDIVPDLQTAQELHTPPELLQSFNQLEQTLAGQAYAPDGTLIWQWKDRALQAEQQIAGIESYIVQSHDLELAPYLNRVRDLEDRLYRNTRKSRLQKERRAQKRMETILTTQAVDLTRDVFEPTPAERFTRDAYDVIRVEELARAA